MLNPLHGGSRQIAVLVFVFQKVLGTPLGASLTDLLWFVSS